jgi:hypothetical protein
LRSLALCRWSQLSGVKDAKKKSLQVTRYRTQVPPALDVLKNPQLINAALDLMLNLRGHWCLDYITGQISLVSIDKKGISLLVTWAQKASQSPLEFLETFLKNYSCLEMNENRLLLLIKEIISKLVFAQNMSSEDVSIKTLEAVEFMIKQISDAKSEKLRAEFSNLLKKIIDSAISSSPTVVIHGYFLQSLYLISQVQQLKKISQVISSKQIASTLKVLEDLCTFGGKDGISYFNLLTPALKNAYPNFDKCLADFSRTSPILLNLKNNQNSSNEINLEDTATSIYARLLPSWNDFYRDQSDRVTLSLINSDLEAASRLNGIEFLGTEGELVPYDPVSHRLRNESGSVPIKVRIIRPAIIFRRANGTFRIIIPAIVDLS